MRADEVFSPVTIFATRYGGTYEGSVIGSDGTVEEIGGAFAALNVLPHEVPPEAFGGDPVAATWWDGIEEGRLRHPARLCLGERIDANIFVAFGKTPGEAYDRLAAVWRARGES